MKLKSKIKFAFYDFKYRFVKKKLIKKFGYVKSQTERVVIKKGGVYNGKAIENEVQLEIKSLKNIGQFNKLFEIAMPSEISLCMCAGDYAIELYNKQDGLITTIGFHHNTSIRMDGYIGDADLINNKFLLMFFNDLGFYPSGNT